MKYVVTNLVVILALFIGNVYALECPKFPEQLKKDWEVKVSAEVAKLGPLKGADLRTATKTTTQDLLNKIPDTGKIYLEQMMYAAYCTTLRDDKTLTETERSNRILEYNREVRRTINASKSTSSKVSKGTPKASKPPAKKQDVAVDSKKLPSGTPSEKNVTVTSHGQTGGITANEVTINIEQKDRIIQRIDGNIECVFSGNWKDHPGDIVPISWNRGETWTRIFKVDAKEEGVIQFSLDNMEMTQLPDGNLQVTMEVSSKTGTGAIGQDLSVLYGYRKLLVYIPFIHPNDTLDKKIKLREVNAAFFVNGVKRSQINESANFEIPIPQGKALGFELTKDSIFPTP